VPGDGAGAVCGVHRPHEVRGHAQEPCHRSSTVPLCHCVTVSLSAGPCYSTLSSLKRGHYITMPLCHYRRGACAAGALGLAEGGTRTMGGHT